MSQGDIVKLDQYSFKFNGVTKAQGANYTADVGDFAIYKKDALVANLNPEKRLYLVQQMPMTEAGIDSTLFRDVFIALGEPLDNGAWAVRIYIKPFVVWIWAGAAIMALGGLCSLCDKRYRLAKRVTKKNRAKHSNHATTPIEVL
jgi:cytochrome c-type biogenesis protein CcmF